MAGSPDMNDAVRRATQATIGWRRIRKERHTWQRQRALRPRGGQGSGGGAGVGKAGRGKACSKKEPRSSQLPRGPTIQRGLTA